MVKMSKSFVIRMVVWSALVLYLMVDFLVIDGPIAKKWRASFPSDEQVRVTAVDRGICATVFRWPIYLSQVDRRVDELLWRTGRDPEKVSAQERDILRRGAMDSIIGEYLLRIKTKANLEKINVTKDQIDAEVARFEKRFSSPGALAKAMNAQGIESAEELRLRLTAILQQEQYLALQMEESISISEKEAREWYDKNKDSIALPERRRARHVFIATLDTPSDEARTKLSAHLAEITQRKTNIAKLASTVSEDEASKTKGGDLGWMRRARLPGDFAATLFSIQKNTPTLVRTKLGWHILEVTDIKPAAPLPFEACQEEITTTLTDSLREASLKQYYHQLRLINRKSIKVYAEVFGKY